MEADGFTLVKAGEQNLNRVKTRDDPMGTTIIGISQEKAKELWERQQAKVGRNTAGKYISGKEQKDLVRADFYQFQKRLVQKDKIE